MKSIRYRQLFVGLVVSFAASAASNAQLPEFTHLVKEISPAVVNISVQRSAAARVPRGDRFDEREMPELFRRFFRDMPHPRPQPRNRPTLGSGFIISSDGYILTNNHVVENADEIIVSLQDRREREAKVVGADTLSDLALLKIDASDLVGVKLGSSEKLQVGEWVVAIGSPFGFEYSVTAGIVSAKGRSLPDSNQNYVPFIQTDVAINPGNSGGPLFNLDGEVVGINSQIFTRSGGFMGLSFAIPIDVALDVVEQLKDKGSVSRGWLGVLIQRVNRDLAESFGLDRPSGALVLQVYSDSPAESAGLREGDIIIEFNGMKIDLSADLPHVVGRTKADTKANIVIVREGKKKTLAVVVGQLSDSTLSIETGESGSQSGNRLGLVVEELSDEDKDRRGVKDGIQVVEVLDGAAGKAGMRSGDIVTMLDSQWVKSVQQFNEIVDSLVADDSVPIRIVRNQSPMFLAIKVIEP
ncbi:MAG: DegQ family serine endoprotease [Pseudomonadales bacterium]|nr:DegQ family serine endoprotease [Pseudomonadales bacterium]MDP7145898.1 DegQ family serine endoprotease [Pseudomonadales bacterium]HJN50099.1 DegQ family serine endoprotease [Pseudomonadales bacterium]